MSRHGALTNDIATNFEIADCDQEVWTRVMMLGERRSGLENDFRSADTVFDKENILGAAFEDVHAALFVPLGRRRFARFFVLHEFDGDIAEGLAGKIFGDVGEASREEIGVTIF